MFTRLFVLTCGAVLAFGCNKSSSPPAPARAAANTDAADHASRSGSTATPGSAVSTGTPTDGDASGAYDATNTGRNKRDRDENAVTADDQSQSSDDVKTSAEIRRAVTSDKSLSVNAHNVKIIVRDGKVTLRGPVDSEEEKAAIAADAARIAGEANVVDELEVK